MRLGTVQRCFARSSLAWTSTRNSTPASSRILATSTDLMALMASIVWVTVTGEAVETDAGFAGASVLYVLLSVYTTDPEDSATALRRILKIRLLLYDGLPEAT